MLRLIWLILACTAFEASAVDLPIEASLCTPQEIIVFSCTARGKTVSLCRSPELVTERGYMQYRFGTRDRNVEMEYPGKSIHPSTAFLAWQDGAAKWSVDYLRFSRGEFEYLVFMQRAVFDSNGGGLIVKRNGRKLGQWICPRNRIKDELYGLDRFGIQAPKVEFLQYQDDISRALEVEGVRN